MNENVFYPLRIYGKHNLTLKREGGSGLNRLQSEGSRTANWTAKGPADPPMQVIY
jgi:hypothetical protein